MLFFDAKKPIELSVINLNDSQDALKTRLKSKGVNKNKGKSKKCKMASCLKSYFKKTDNGADSDKRKTVFVLDFIGDLKANAVARLREEVSTILSVATDSDEVILRLESAGGQVHGYGLAAAQLERLRAANIALTVCVDKVAASGGYMMACVGSRVIGAPFAILGSIGVVSQMPNFYEFLQKHDVDVELFTAGEYKRTVTMFGKNNDDDRAKYQEELDRIHTLFKQHVSEHRPQLDIEKVATGEFWFGTDAKALNLIDELGTSDAYILDKLKDSTVLMLHSHQKPTLVQRLGLSDTASVAAELFDIARGVGVQVADKLPLLLKK